MKLIEVKNPRWSNAEHTMLDVDATFDSVGTIPFTARPTEGEFGPSIFAAALDGEYGAIANYIAPPEPIPDLISRRQFFQQLAAMEMISNADALAAMQRGVIPAPLQTIIDTLPEENQFESQMLIVGADSFNRTHPLTETVRLAMQWTEEQRDSFWLEASKL